MPVTTSPAPGSVLDCGHVCPPRPHTGPSGYAVSTDDGATLCYPCADDSARDGMAGAIPGERADVYLSADGRTVTTWTGGHLGHVTASTTARLHTPQGAPYDRVSVRVVDVHGQHWHGTGTGRGMHLGLRRSK